MESKDNYVGSTKWAQDIISDPLITSEDFCFTITPQNLRDTPFTEIAADEEAATTKTRSWKESVRQYQQKKEEEEVFMQDPNKEWLHSLARCYARNYPDLLSGKEEKKATLLSVNVKDEDISLLPLTMLLIKSKKYQISNRHYSDAPSGHLIGEDMAKFLNERNASERKEYDELLGRIEELECIADDELITRCNAHANEVTHYSLYLSMDREKDDCT